MNDVKKRESTATTLARIDERVGRVESDISELKAFLRTDYLKHMEDRVSRLEKHNAQQDKKIEMTTRLMWKTHGLVSGLLIIMQVVSVLWRAFGGQ